jgi:phospholipid N-methyltransferase
MSTLVYLKNLFTDRYVASVTPTSRLAVEKVCEKIDFDSRRVIIEYGPGTGVFTQNLLKNMTPDSRVLAIERNANFCGILEREMVDPRLSIFHDDAGNVLDVMKSCNEPQADYILSGIPFSFLPPEKKMEVLLNAHAALKPGGKFLAYQHFCQLPDHLRNHLEKVFPSFRTQYFMFSLPPLLIFEAVKETEPPVDGSTLQGIAVPDNGHSKDRKNGRKKNNGK